ncbi:MAG: hypothetical protein OMM_12535, partial [Candidatus Magnetoglobus multicellularis str. Araruama]
MDKTNQWKNFPDLPIDYAFLLADKDKIRFVPDEQNKEIVTFDFYIWDQVNGQPGNVYNITNRGGITGFSQNSGTARLSVSDINDAPVFKDIPLEMRSVTEDDIYDDVNKGMPISEIVLNAITDVDNNSKTGIAIISCTGNGKWEYQKALSSDWIEINHISKSNALLLTEQESIRYVPDEINGEIASFECYAWDQSSTNNNITDTGETTAFSSKTKTVSIEVTDINDAPLLEQTESNLSSISEDNINYSGYYVYDIIKNVISDADTNALTGIAIVEASGNNQWQFYRSGWHDITKVSPDNAYLFKPDERIRYLPDGKNGETVSFKFHAWDQSSDNTDTTIWKNTSAFSEKTAIRKLKVISENDAPVLNTTSPVMVSINEDNTGSQGTRISDIIGNSMSDVDNDASQKGIAIYEISGINTDYGWQYASGNAWIFIGSVSEEGALLLDWNTKIRYKPNTRNGESAYFKYYAWD